MSPSRLATTGLIATMLFAATPALAGNGSATGISSNAQQIERLGPKYLLTPVRPQTSTLSATLTPRTISPRVVEQLGPKYLVSYELKAAQS